MVHVACYIVYGLCFFSHHLAHVHEVEDVDRDAKQGVEHGRDLPPLRSGW